MAMRPRGSLKLNSTTASFEAVELPINWDIHWQS
jgi:hypothetical protein